MVHDVALFGRQLAERHVRAHAHLAAHVFHERPHEAAPHGHGAFVDGFRLVGHERAHVHRAHNTGAAARGAGALAVERERFRARSVEALAADGAREGLLERHVHRRGSGMPVRALVASQARERKSQVVQQLGGCAECGANVGHGWPLAKRQGGWHVQDLVDVGPFRLGNASTRVSGERIQVPSRPFRVQHSQGERRLPRSRHPGDADRAPQRDVDRNVFQVVNARAAHLNAIGHVSFRFSCVAYNGNHTPCF